ncbi:MAG: hypothetical protein COV35_03570 [Alphaproteobacteria bacterium CG11_big_fil_rev_8_21_14_0_20_39_49]|nr:MAG: hypothetical protein COV35_03570 [Alphaproteobacteria bacterium CG11_big_fil_rev_8_21_14_0_20_39_49]
MGHSLNNNTILIDLFKVLFEIDKFAMPNLVFASDISSYYGLTIVSKLKNNAHTLCVLLCDA